LYGTVRIPIVTVPALASQPGAINVWFVDSLTKVFLSDTPGKHRPAAPDFWAARNQHMSIQFAIRSAKALKDVSAEITPVKSTRGEPLDGVTVRSVGYVVVGSHSDDTPPDELIGEAPG
jgi:hypothetical protein